MNAFNGMISVKEVAETMGVHQSTVSRWISLGKLPALRVGSTYRIKPEDMWNMVQPTN